MDNIYMNIFRIKYLFIFVLFIQSNIVYSAANPFEIDYADVRLPAGYSSNNTREFKELLNKPFSSGAQSTVKQGFNVGKASLNVGLIKNFANADIAKAVAAAIFNKTALGMLGMLAIPYVVDGVSDLFKVIPGSSTNPITTSPTGLSYKIYTDWFSTPLDACRASYPTSTVSYFSNQFNCMSTSGGVYSGVYQLGSCPVGTTLSYSGVNQGKCVYNNPQCTAPSTYDSATGMCVGSSNNEPANLEQLESDINASLDADTAKSKAALDALNEKNIVPETTNQTEIDDSAIPQPVPVSTSESTKQYHDQATGHPMTETTTTNKTMEFAKTGPKELTGKEVQNVTTTVTDTVTNVTTTTTVNNSSQASPAGEETDPPTDCDKFPDSIGCSKYGDIPNPQTIQTKTIDASLNHDSVAGQCPADVVLTLYGGRQITFSWQAACNGAAMLRPINISAALLGAAFFVLSALVI